MRWVDAPPRGLLPGVILLCLPAYAQMAWVAAAHCDEFNLLRHVTDFAYGNFTEPGRPGLLFFPLIPLTWLGSPEAAFFGSRGVALLLLGWTAWLAGKLASRLGGPLAAPLAAGILLLSANTLAHGIELRTDSLTTPLALVSLGIVLEGGYSVRKGILLGALMGLAFTVSQKSVYATVSLYGAASVGWLLRPGESRKAAFKPLMLLLGTAGIACGAVIVGWYAFMGGLSGMGVEFARVNLSAAAGTAFTEEASLADKLRVLRKSFELAPLTYGGALLAALYLPFRPSRSPSSSAEGPSLPPRAAWGAVVLFALGTVATLWVHRGYFLYFTASYEAFHSALAASLLTLGIRHRPRLGAWVAVGLLALALVVTVPKGIHYTRVHNGYQLAILREVREMYPSPVPYADAIGMIPGYPMVGYFNTRLNRSWNQEKNPAGRVTAWREAPALFYIYEYCSRTRYLNPAEKEFFQTRYLPYRNNLYLHGGRVVAGPQGTPAVAEVEMLADGPYTVHFHPPFQGEATVDGAPVKDRQVVTLTRGFHALKAGGSPRGGEVWLLHGKDRVPAARPVNWSGFIPLSRERFQDYKNTDLKTPRENAQWRMKAGK